MTQVRNKAALLRPVYVTGESLQPQEGVAVMLGTRKNLTHSSR